MFLGIEIGGTKLQLGLGRGDGVIAQVWRGKVVQSAGGDGIRRQILDAVPELLAKAEIGLASLAGIGVGFGGPTDDATHRVIRSHHIHGWDDFPLADWLSEQLGRPAVICNDADVAGLAEARYGAGRGLSPIFYITAGTGIGGGLIIDGKIYRGVGKGAAEIGHVRPVYPLLDRPHDGILETFASGTGIGERGSQANGMAVATAAMAGDAHAKKVIDEAAQGLAEGICTVIKLLCPRRIVIGGGVSLMPEELFLAPVRRYVAERGMVAFAGLADIVVAELGEEVVVHGALALASQRFQEFAAG